MSAGPFWVYVGASPYRKKTSSCSWRAMMPEKGRTKGETLSSSQAHHDAGASPPPQPAPPCPRLWAAPRGAEDASSQDRTPEEPFPAPWTSGILWRLVGATMYQETSASCRVPRVECPLGRGTSGQGPAARVSTRTVSPTSHAWSGPPREGQLPLRCRLPHASIKQVGLGAPRTPRCDPATHL
jgi:hypothetical protein